MKKYQTPSFLIALALLTTLAVQCGPQATQVPIAEEKVLKVGVIGPFTGPSAATGQQSQNAIVMAFEKIGKIGDYRIELVWIDSQSKPEEASLAYEKAVLEDGIQAGFWNWHSSVAVAVMEVTAEYKVPHFFTAGVTELVNDKVQANPEKYGYWNYKMLPAPSNYLTFNYVAAIEAAIADGLWDPGKKRAAIYMEDTDYGHSLSFGLKRDLESAGWTIVDEQYFPPDQTEFHVVLNQFKGKDIDLIGITSTGADSRIALVKQIDEIGLKALIIADGLGWTGNWYELTGSSSNYVLDRIPDWVTDEGKAFAREYEARWDIYPSPIGVGTAYDAANFFIRVAQATFEQHGELNSQTLYRFGQEKIQTGEFTFTDGIVQPRYKYTPETVPDPVVGKGHFTYFVLQYVDGKKVVIWPEEFRQADLQIRP
jgi:branched-chain amino acid transport system substrate-binding protein